MACAAVWAGLAGDEQLFHLEVAVRRRGKNIPVEIDSTGSAASVPRLSVRTASPAHDCDVALKLSSEHLLPVCVDIVMKVQNAVCARSSAHVGFSRSLSWDFAGTFSSPAAWEIFCHEKLLFVVCCTPPRPNTRKHTHEFIK